MRKKDTTPDENLEDRIMNTTVTDEQVRRLAETAKPYSLGLLWWSQERSKEGADATEREHQRRMVSLRADGVIAILCPVGSDTLAGVAIMNVPPEAASEILDGDPCVQAGIMRREVYPCHGFPGDAPPRRVRAVTIRRMDHVGVVVDDLESAIAFFVELGMERDGGTTFVEGDWVDRVVGLDGVRVEIAFVRTPDGHGRLELTKFHNPTATTAEPNAPPNTFGLRRIMFAVDDLDDLIARMEAHDAELIGEVARYEDLYRLCYLRGPDGIIVALAEELR